MFASLFPLFKGLLTGMGEITLAGEEGVGIGAQLPPQVY